MSQTGSGTKRGVMVAWGVGLALLFVALVWPVALSGRGGTSEARDQKVWHSVGIEEMAADWPRFDLRDYHSATAPGYHMVMATLKRFVTDEWVALQVMSSVFGLGLVLVVWRTGAGFVGPGRAAMLTGPMLMSTYVLGSSMWLVTDNAANLFVALALGACAMARPVERGIVRGAVWATCAVCVRQIHLWCAAPMILAAVVRSPLGERFGMGDGGERWSWGRTIARVPALMGPMVVVGVLALLWGGMTPPAFQGFHHSGLSPLFLVLMFSLVGAFGVFFMPIVTGGMLPRIDRWAGLVMGLAGSWAFVFSGWDADVENLRYGPIWRVVEKMPTVGGRSVVLPVLGAIGGLFLIEAWRRARAAGRGREATMMLVAMAAWAVSRSVSPLAWQRYAEVVVLLFVAWLAALCVRGDGEGGRSPGWVWFGPVVLALFQAAIAYKGIYEPVMGWTGGGG